jgi:hypothetical protein
VIRKNRWLKQRQKFDNMINKPARQQLLEEHGIDHQCCLQFQLLSQLLEQKMLVLLQYSIHAKFRMECNTNNNYVSFLLFKKEKTNLVQRSQMKTKFIYNRRTNQLIEELEQFLCIFLEPLQTHYMGGYLGKS